MFSRKHWIIDCLILLSCTTKKMCRQTVEVNCGDKFNKPLHSVWADWDVNKPEWTLNSPWFCSRGLKKKTRTIWQQWNTSGFVLINTYQHLLLYDSLLPDPASCNTTLPSLRIVQLSSEFQRYKTSTYHYEATWWCLMSLSSPPSWNVNSAGPFSIQYRPRVGLRRGRLKQPEHCLDIESENFINQSLLTVFYLFPLFQLVHTLHGKWRRDIT